MVFVGQRVITVEREEPGYTQADFRKWVRISKALKEDRKDSEFRKAVKEFIRRST